ncbi:hypothetical protein MRB53_041605 [Persea americana]|nr:hypothetical protein MRB53_041605 [Persea americana]
MAAAAAAAACCDLLPRRELGVVVYTRVTCQLIAAAEALGAAWKLTAVWLLAGVRADVAGLMFEAMESLFAERALVRSWQVCATLVLAVGWAMVDACHGHGRDSSGHVGRRILEGSRLCG